jgi:hypothetical protein
VTVCLCVERCAELRLFSPKLGRARFELTQGAVDSESRAVNVTTQLCTLCQPLLVRGRLAVVLELEVVPLQPPLFCFCIAVRVACLVLLHDVMCAKVEEG